MSVKHQPAEQANEYLDRHAKNREAKRVAKRSRLKGYAQTSHVHIDNAKSKAAKQETS